MTGWVGFINIAKIADALKDAGPQAANHLWQSTVFLGMVAALALVLRKNHARTRYWLWMAAAAKFLVPFSLLVALGSHLPWPSHAAPAKASTYVAIDAMSQPFSEDVDFDAPMIAAQPVVSHAAIPLLSVAIAGVWLLGFVGMTAYWCVQWRRVSKIVRAAEPLLEGREVECMRRLEWTEQIRTSDAKAPTNLAGGNGTAEAGPLSKTRHSPARGGIELRLSGSSMEPGVVGLLRPVLLWPEGISRHLDDAHLERVLAHEVCHVRRRDNLTSVVPMLVEAVFWFHPLVWWMERQLVKERERACDEDVLLRCGEPGVYAQSILKVCEYCVESPLACVSGITGADLKRRVVQIMAGGAALRLTWPKKLLLGAVAVCAVGVPVVLGQARAAQRMMLAAIDSAPKPFRAAARALTPVEETPSTGEIAEMQAPAVGAAVPPTVAGSDDLAVGPAFEVATIRPANRDDGRRRFGIREDDSGHFLGSAVSLGSLVQGAYGEVAVDREAPTWVNSEDFDINAKVDDAYMAGWDKLSDAQRRRLVRPMVRRLLADRFKLKLRTEMQDIPVYALVQAKGGTKMKEVPPPPPPEGRPSSGFVINCPPSGKVMTCTGKAVPMSQMIGLFTGFGDLKVGRAVVDETGLKGYYDYSFTVSTDADADPPMKQIEDQLRLRFEPRKVPGKVYVIESAEKPTLDGAEVQGQAGFVPVVMVLGQAKAAQRLMLATINAAPKPQTVYTMPADQSQASDGIAQAPAIATLTVAMPVVASQRWVWRDRMVGRARGEENGNVRIKSANGDVRIKMLGSCERFGQLKRLLYELFRIPIAFLVEPGGQFLRRLD